jgi:hypothetical protein
VVDPGPQLQEMAEAGTEEARAPGADAAYRRGRRRRRRRLAGVGLLVVAVTAGLVLPTRIDREAGVPAAGQLTPPAVGQGELAVVIEAPPAGLPGTIRVARIQCGAATSGAIYGEARILGGRRPVEVAPTPVRIGDVVGRLASVQLSEDYSQGRPGRFLMLREDAGARFELETPDGTRGSALGPWVLTDEHGRLVERPTGAWAAVAWSCPGS